jgi:hypothetical protein
MLQDQFKGIAQIAKIARIAKLKIEEVTMIAAPRHFPQGPGIGVQ